MEIEIKDVSPEFRLAEIKKAIPIQNTNIISYGWIIGFTIIGTIGIGIFLISQHAKKKRQNSALN
jgi:hypothetical protein